MIALILGLLFIAFAVWAVLPMDFPLGLQWGSYVLDFLKGGAPIFGLLIGVIAFFIGIADIKDKIEAKKEEKNLDKEQEQK